jgi:Ca-activated chloride channel family protein
MLADGLRESDRIAIVVYAGASGVVLEPTNDKHAVKRALGRLEAGGSTAGAEGIQLAYDVAQRTFRKGGINRVILASDGDFNVGPSSQGELVNLIEDKRRSGVFLSVLGFGTGNLNDAMMESIADHGNGNYAYIDSEREAERVLVEQANSTLVTIAKDVKIQVEFNPARVESYRLIGYENRVLAHDDFNDDQKDAGEIGAGHTVTALYEIAPAGSGEAVPRVDPLRYQNEGGRSAAAATDELMTVKIRYKQPDGDESSKLSFPVTDDGRELADTTDDYRFSAAVAAFGMLLRSSKHGGKSSWALASKLARGALGRDERGDRREFVDLVQKASTLAGGGQARRATP